MNYLLIVVLFSWNGSGTQGPTMTTIETKLGTMAACQTALEMVLDDVERANQDDRVTGKSVITPIVKRCVKIQ